MNHWSLFNIVRVFYKCGLIGRPRKRGFKAASVMENARVCMRTNVAITTHNKVQANKPNIVMHDKKTNEIWIVEVGITSLDRLQETEIEKTRKYVSGRTCRRVGDTGP